MINSVEVSRMECKYKKPTEKQNKKKMKSIREAWDEEK